MCACIHQQWQGQHLTSDSSNYQLAAMQEDERTARPNRLSIYRSRRANVLTTSCPPTLLSRANSFPRDNEGEEPEDHLSTDVHNSKHSLDDMTEKRLDFDLQTLLWNLVENNNNNNTSNSELGNRVFKSCKDIEERIRKKSMKKVKRRVSFADSIGLDLASIRIVTDGRDTPPLLDRIYDNFDQVKEAKRVLQPLFSQPISRFSDFLKQLTQNFISLESVVVTGDAITGVVKVKNLAFEKSVVVRYTTDDWRSSTDVECTFVTPAYSFGQQTSVHDTFSFRIETAESCQSLEFCISYRCQCKTYWDNNNNRNYRLERQSTTSHY